MCFRYSVVGGGGDVVNTLSPHTFSVTIALYTPTYALCGAYVAFYLYFVCRSIPNTHSFYHVLYYSLVCLKTLTKCACVCVCVTLAVLWRDVTVA